MIYTWYCTVWLASSLRHRSSTLSTPLYFFYLNYHHCKFTVTYIWFSIISICIVLKIVKNIHGFKVLVSVLFILRILQLSCLFMFRNLMNKYHLHVLKSVIIFIIILHSLNIQHVIFSKIYKAFLQSRFTCIYI